MVTSAVEENLRFVFQPSKGSRVNDAVAIPLKIRAPNMGRLFKGSSAGVRAELRVRRQSLPLVGLQLFARLRHDG